MGAICSDDRNKSAAVEASVANRPNEHPQPVIVPGSDKSSESVPVYRYEDTLSQSLNKNDWPHEEISITDDFYRGLRDAGDEERSYTSGDYKSRLSLLQRELDRMDEQFTALNDELMAQKRNATTEESIKLSRLKKWNRKILDELARITEMEAFGDDYSDNATEYSMKSCPSTAREKSGHHKVESEGEKGSCSYVSHCCRHANSDTGTVPAKTEEPEPADSQPSRSEYDDEGEEPQFVVPGPEPIPQDAEEHSVHSDWPKEGVESRDRPVNLRRRLPATSQSMQTPVFIALAIILFVVLRFLTQKREENKPRAVTNSNHDLTPEVDPAIV